MTETPRIKIYASFTSIFSALFSGTLTLEELGHPRARLFFGCIRDHIFCGSMFPREVTWFREDGFPARHDTYAVAGSEVGPRSRVLFREFQEVIRRQEEQGHVRFGGGNLSALRTAALAAGCDFWWKEDVVPSADSDRDFVELLEGIAYDGDVPVTDWERINADVAWALSTVTEGSDVS